MTSPIDVRFTLRQMRRSPGIALTAILSIALGIGAATSIFSVVDGVVLDPFPYKDVDSLMSVKVWEPGQRGHRTYYTVDQFLEIAERSTIFSGVTVSTIDDVLWTGEGEPQRLRGNHTTYEGLEIMGVPPVVGRIFTKSDGASGADAVCVLGYRFWQRQFGGNPAVVGKTLILNNKARTVLGVMPPRFMWRGADVYLPLHFHRGVAEEGVRYVHVLGRLRPGVTEAQAETDLRPIIEELREREPSQFPETFRVGLLSFAETFPSGLTDILWLLFAAVGLLLLIACANVSNLLLSQGVSRRREMAVRSAIGAGRGRLISQLLTESVVLALIGGVLGVILSWVGTKAILSLVPPFTIPDESEVAINLPVLLFSLGASFLTALIFGLAPALQCTKINLATALREGSRGSSGGKGQVRLRALLVVAEVALSVVLLVSAGLMMRTMLAMQSLDLGVRTDKLLTFKVPLPDAGYPDAVRSSGFMEALLDRLANTPGVVAAGVNTYYQPVANLSALIEVPGLAKQDNRRVLINSVNAGYWSVYGISLRAGRFFDRTDVFNRRHLAVVSERLVRRYFADGQALGRVVQIPRLRQAPAKLENDQFEIIGVVSNTTGGSLREELPELYVPHTIVGLSNCFAVRTVAQDPLTLLPSVRAAVSSIDKNQPISDVMSMEHRLDQSLFSSRRFNAVLFGVFAGLGLVLAVVGVYGILANSVSRRRREIGVRMAMGATFGDVRSLVLSQGARLIGIGLVIGLLASLVTSHYLQDFIWNVSAFDPVSLIVVAAVLIAAGLAASWVPARRAARVDPMTALRYE